MLDMGTKSTRFPNVRWRGDTLYFRYIGADGRQREVKYGQGSPKDAARAQQAAQERADAERRGLLDPRAEELAESGRRPIALVIADYAEHLRGKRDSAGHVKGTVAYLTRWAKDCNVGCLLDAKPGTLARWLAKPEWSARSRNAARMAVVSLCRWAADYGHVAYNPMPAGLVPRASEDADRRRTSRALTPDELGRLLAAAGRDRAAYYALAAYTGLRWREIARLRWCDVDLDAGVVTCSAGQTKNGRAATLPLNDAVAGRLVALREKQTPHSANPVNATFLQSVERSAVFHAEPRLRTWKRDLAKAGIAYDDGGLADRKCLRLTFGTSLKRAGVDLRDAQRLMRHSDPALTANIYTDIRLPDLRAAVGKIVDGGDKRKEQA